MNYTNIFPKQMFLDVIIATSKKELKEECDYIQEARNQMKMKEIIENSDMKEKIKIGKIIEELSSEKIISSEFMKGMSLEDVIKEGSQELRNRVGSIFMEVTLRQIFEFNCIQTDPNPANFSYCPKTNKVQMVDFGAVQSYS